MHPALDLRLPITAGYSYSDLNYLDFHYPKEKVKSFIEQFLFLNCDYQNLLDVLEYCKILQELAESKTQLVMLNGILPITQEMQYLQSVTDPAKNFSQYTKELINVDLLPDEDIAKFFTKIVNGINRLDKSIWPNMFSSFANNIIDYGSDKLHPGTNSHKQYADMIIKHLKQ
jgi:hypothetical protein